MIMVEGVRKSDLRAIFAVVTVVTGVQSRNTFSQVISIFSYGRMLIAYSLML